MSSLLSFSALLGLSQSVELCVSSMLSFGPADFPSVKATAMVIWCKALFVQEGGRLSRGQGRGISRMISKRLVASIHKQTFTYGSDKELDLSRAQTGSAISTIK